MVRRGPSSDEDNSPTPVKNANIKVKAEKVKAEKVRAEKGKGKARDDEEEGSPKGAKRARANDAGDAVPPQEDENEPDDGGEKDDDDAPKRVKTLPRDVDGFIPGSILRIQLRNFVTYDAVEFRPGAYLNMILGPNGTGKSSIACAICLGLNWSPAILGRSTELKSFVKLGTDDGHIEIELKAPAGERNLVIRRNISTKKGSTFTLNGHSATGREITERVAKLNVQVGNLCSFLPQDKVSDFAAMSPQALLQETQRAAGDERLSSWHKTLIGAGQELKTIMETIKTERANVHQMQERNDNIERDVQRYRERKSIEKKIEMLQVLIPVQHYREERRRYMVLKERQRAMHARVSKLKEKNKPAHAFLAKLQTQYAELEGDRNSCKKTLRIKHDKLTLRIRDSERLENDVDDLQNTLSQLKKSEKAREANIKKFEGQIVKVKEDLEREVKLENEADVNAERATARSAGAKVDNDRRALNEKNEALRRRKDHNSENAQRARQDLRQLDDKQSVKLRNLEKWDRDVADAVKWLRNNRDLFEKDVFEPPYVSASVPDPTFAAAVESCFNASALKMFVCQTKKDYDTLNNRINDNPGLGRSVRVPTWFRPGTDADLAPPPLSREELTALGFDDYALKYIECPPGLEWFFKRELNMHRTAISKNGVKDVKRAIELVGRPGPNGRTANTTFLDRNTSHQVSRSRYGRHELSSTTGNVNPARNFTGQAQDPAEKRRIDEILLTCKRNAEELEEEQRTLNDEASKNNVLVKEQKAILDAIEQRLNTIRNEAQRKLKLKRDLQKLEDQLAAAQKKGNAVQEGARIRADIMKIAKKRAKLVKEAIELAREIIEEQTKATVVGLQYLQIGAKIAALQDLCDRKTTRYNAALAEFNAIDAEFKEVKAKSGQLMRESVELLNNLSEELREEYSVIEARRNAYEQAVEAARRNGQDPPDPDEDVDLRTMDELQAELELQEANLEMNTNTNPGVVEQYEKRKRDIAALEKTLEGRQRNADKIERKIKNARDNWEPALQKLVASIGKKFSAAFDRIGCAGEIRVRQDEAYENWAIDILVKFRDTEKLQLLTGQRQSGGERSLTTILYLMSLTEEARAPFSLVDEINQGMDQRAERMVHNSMVEVTCKADSAQYFLITPKLLPDLEYHERMKVLCVNNGEWLPDESGLGNMMRMIDGYVAKQRQQ